MNAQTTPPNQPAASAPGSSAGTAVRTSIAATLRSAFTVPARYGVDDPLITQHAQLILRMSLTLMALSLFGFVALLSTFSGDTGDTLTLVGIAVIFIGSLVAVRYVQQGQTQAAAYGLVAGLTVGVAAVLLPYSYNNIGALMLLVPLPLTAVLLGRTGLLVNLWALFAAVIVSSLVSARYILAPDLLLGGTFSTAAMAPYSVIVLGGFLLCVNGLVLWFVADEQQVRTRLQRRAEQSTQLALQISRVLGTYTSRETLLSQIPDEVRDKFGYYYVQIFVIDTDNQLLIRPVRMGSLSIQVRVERRIRLDDRQNVIAELVRSGQSRVIALNAPLGERSEFLGATRQELLLLLRYQDRVWGVLDIHSVQTDSFGPRDLEVMENVANQIATTLSALDSSAVVHTIGGERLRLRDQVDRLTHDLEQLRQEANVRAWVGYLATRRKMATGFDWQEGHLQVNDSMTPSLTRGLNDSLPQLQIDGSEQVLTVPISVRGIQLGALEFRSPAQNWTESSLELARLIGQRLALILDNVRLIEQSRNAELRERLINQVSGQLQGETNLDSLLSTAADAFSQALGATSTRIQLTVPEKTLANPTNGQTEPDNHEN